MSTLYIVGTPIGNMEDITIRALKVLNEVDLILCEDTRVTRKLLDRHGIQKQTMSYHAHSTLSKVSEIIESLKAGKNIALVSDAGTPAISDPGSELVRMVRAELAELLKSGDLKIVAIPGPSALTSALSVAGIPCADFVFLGFLPHKKGRETLFKEIIENHRTTVFYESPHRIMKTLESLQSKGLEKRVTVCRELTKIFEEVVSGTITEVRDYFSNNEEKIRGEFVVII